MKRVFAAAALVMSGAVGLFAQNKAVSDTTTVREMQELVVSGVRAKKYAPFAVTNINRNTLEEYGRTGQELPLLFSRTPGVMAWSENGLGTGTTYMRIRGAADSRICVTLDGVPLNAPEDQCVFWANMNSYASLLGSAQIQRGVGTSTQGDGAFGGNLTLNTKAPSLVPSLEVSANYGSYNTYNVGGSLSSGLWWNHLTLDAAFHHTGTEGYVHGTAGNSGSFYANLSWMSNDRRLVLSYRNIGNYEHTGQAWNGVVTGNDDNSLLSGNHLVWNDDYSQVIGTTATGISSYGDMYRAGLGRFNSLYERLDTHYGQNDFADDQGCYTTSRYQMADGTLWDRTTDNFNQDHNILQMAWQMASRWNSTATLHYTYGYGYYEEFRPDNKLKKFGLATFTLSDGSTLKKTDFVRRKGLEQHTYGMTWNTNYRGNRADLTGGLSMQQYQGDHFGYLTYIKDSELAAACLAGGRYTYYDSDATKGDMSMYVKGTCHLTRCFDVFADLQARLVRYETEGINDKFYANDDGTYTNQLLSIDKHYTFLNPKAGVSYHNDGHQAYASWAMSHREPERNNFTDNGNYPAPQPERVHDFETGYTYRAKGWNLGANLYWMDYRNQFVQTGMKSDIGENLTTNVRDSYRIGVELTAGASPCRWLDLEANAALSRNRIRDFDEVVEDWENGERTIHYDHSTLAYSPSVMLNVFADFKYRRFKVTWHTGYVGRQYLDNTACQQRSLPAYTRTDIRLTYPMSCGGKGLKEILYGLDLNNIFNAHYATSGWVYSAITNDVKPNSDRYTQIGYIPAAGFTLMGHLTLRF